MTEATAQPEAEWKPSACILCECNCGIEVLVEPGTGHFVKIRGDKLHPSSAGYTCNKALRLDAYQNGRTDRLRTPLRRRPDGSFEEVDWDTALREVAERLGQLRDEHGGESIFYYGGGGQGNHLGGAYAPATMAAFGARYRSNALAQRRRPASSGSTPGCSASHTALTSRRPRSLSSSARTPTSPTASRAPARAQGDCQGPRPVDDRHRSGAHRDR